MQSKKTQLVTWMGYNREIKGIGKWTHLEKVMISAAVFCITGKRSFLHHRVF